jgi:putative FmdB family regulatory protein
MPWYDYYCKECDHEFTESLLMDDRKKPTRRKCPECGRKRVGIMIGAPALVDSMRLTGVRTAPDTYKEVISRINEGQGIKGSRYEVHSEVQVRKENLKELTKHEIKVEVNDNLKAKKGRGK